MTEAKKTVVIAADPRDAEINRLQRAMSHLLTSYQISTARAASLEAENGKLKGKAATLQGEIENCNKEITSLQADMAHTWNAAMKQATTVVEYTRMELGFNGTKPVGFEEAIKAINALATETPVDVAEMVKATKGDAE